MSVQIVVPDLGEAGGEATVSRWLKQAGDSVKSGEAVVVLETDKVDLEVAAETGGAISVGLATFLGIPVSTTHTITGCIMGVGAARRFSAVRWGVAGNIVFAWIVTMPAAALISAAFYELTVLF